MKDIRREIEHRSKTPATAPVGEPVTAQTNVPRDL